MIICDCEIEQDSDFKNRSQIIMDSMKIIKGVRSLMRNYNLMLSPEEEIPELGNEVVELED
jgi:hypothetical protein